MDEKRRKIFNYFKPFPKWTVWLIIIGTIALAGYGAGIVLLIPGIIGLVLYFKGKPTDEEIDQWLLEDSKEIEQLAIDRIGGLDEKSIKEPLTIYKPIIWNVEGIPFTDIQMKIGKDKLYRFSIWYFQVFYLTDKFLGSFGTTWHFIRGKSVNESTEEFFYRDIVKVGTAQESIITVSGYKINSAESFILKVASGDAVTVRDVTLSLAEEGKNPIPTTPIEKTVQAIRTMLRDKKD